MFRLMSIAESRTVMLGVVSTAMLVAPTLAAESTTVPNFSANSRIGWIAGVPDGVTPIGQDFLPPPSGPGPVTFDNAHPYFDICRGAKGRRAADAPRRRLEQSDPAALGERGTEKGQ